MCGIHFTSTEGTLHSRPKRLCQCLPRSEFLHIVSLDSALIIKKIIRVILSFKQDIDVEPEEEEEYLSDDYFEEDSEGYFLSER